MTKNQITFGEPTRPIKKKTTRVYESYDEEGRLTSKEASEEIEYETTPQVLPDPWYQPLISYQSSNTGHKDHVHFEPENK